MRRFSLCFGLLLFGSVFLGALAGIAFFAGHWPVGCLLVIATASFVCGLYALVDKLIARMFVFSKALEMQDYTVRFPASDNHRLNEMAQAMNGIIENHRENLLAVETGKLYYDRILRIISHEMRNGLAPVIALSNDIALHPENYDKETLAEAMNLIGSQSRSLKKFMDSYYSLLHLPKPEPVRIDVARFFDEIRNSYDKSMVEFTIPQGMTIFADRGMLRQVMINLLNNAVHAVEGKEKPRIAVVASYSEGKPYFSISDNGCGIASKDMEFLFQPFFTTKPEGNGIGLCLSRQIVRLHGGDIGVYSTPGKGTTFTVSLVNS